ncbi:MAG: hypothetical protein WDZ85_01840 [Candidatus Paceibacterota bacterium]
MDNKEPPFRHKPALYDSDFSNCDPDLVDWIPPPRPPTLKDRLLSASLWDNFFPGINDYCDKPLEEQLVSIIFYLGRGIWFFSCLFLIGLIAIFLFHWTGSTILHWLGYLLQ